MVFVSPCCSHEPLTLNTAKVNGGISILTVSETFISLVSDTAHSLVMSGRSGWESIMSVASCVDPYGIISVPRLMFREDSTGSVLTILTI